MPKDDLPVLGFADAAAWESWLAAISDRVTKIPGVSTEYIQPEDLSNHAPHLRIKWDGKALNITGTEVSKTLADGSPRISGIETTFDGGQLTFGSMPHARKGADLRRDPRTVHAGLRADPASTDRWTPV